MSRLETSYFDAFFTDGINAMLDGYEDPNYMAWCRTLEEHVGGAAASEWPEAITCLRDGLEQSYGGQVHATCASYRQFTIDVLESAYCVSGRDLGAKMINVLRDMSADKMNTLFLGLHVRPRPSPHTGTTGLGPSRDEELNLSEDLRRAFITDLYQRILGRVRRSAKVARRGTDTYVAWVHALARLTVALLEVQRAPVIMRMGGENGVDIRLSMHEGRVVGAKTIQPGHEVPHLATSWIDPALYEQMRIETVYAEEQFAHVFASVRGAHCREENVNKLMNGGREFVTLRIKTEREHVEFREWLVVERARYRIPAYAFAMLDGLRPRL